MAKSLIKINKIYLLLFISSITLCLIFNLLNLKLEKKYNQGGSAPVFNTTIWSIDNVFYLSPAENYIETGEWRGNPNIGVPAVGAGTYFRRVPGYSIVYYVFHKFTDKKTAHLLIVIFQVLLYGISSIAIYKIFTFLTYRKLSLGLTFIYILLPWFYSYTFFTITEGITPFLMIFFLLFPLKANPNIISFI